MDPFVAEIRIFPFTFAPRGWAFCDGQLMVITQNTALFSLLGTTYGGNGQSTFALPDLRGAAAMHPGQGSGLTPRTLGETGGTDFVTLLDSEMPAHTHGLRAYNDVGENRIPGPTEALARSTGGQLYAPFGPATPMALQSLPPAGGGLPHNNMQPYLTLHFCIALQGVFPPRP
jgi:microcystin-dependent protein